MYPGQVAQLVGASSYIPKVCEFDPWSGQIPKVVGSIPDWGMFRRQPINVSLSH